MASIEKELWFDGFRDKYLRATKKRKKELLDSVVETHGIHRKSATRLKFENSS